MNTSKPAVALLGVAALLVLAGCSPHRDAIASDVRAALLDARAASARISPADSAVRVMQARVRVEPGPINLNMLASALVGRARAQGTEADYVLAERALRRSLVIAARYNDSARLQLAAVLNSQHRFAEGLAIADSVLAENPNSSYAHGIRGDALLERGDLEGARQSYNRAEDLEPGPDALGRLARLAELVGDRGHARAWLAECGRLYDPDGGEPAAWALVQLGLMDLKDGRDGAARARFLRALKFAPGYHLALDGLARCCDRQGRPQEAALLLDAAIERCPRADLLVRRAGLYARAGRADQARRLSDYAGAVLESSYRSGSLGHVRDLSLWLIEHGGSPGRALQLARTDSTLRAGAYVDDALARAYRAAGLRAAAADAAQRAVRRLPWDPDLLERACAILRAAGRSTQSAELARRAHRAWGAAP